MFKHCFLYGLCTGFLFLGAYIGVKFNYPWGALLVAISALLLVVIQHRRYRQVTALFKGEVDNLAKRTERALRADIAWASIIPYLEIAYWFDEVWHQVVSDTKLMVDKDYYLKVTQDCTLVHGDNSVQLKKGWNVGGEYTLPGLATHLQRGSQ